MVTTRPQYRHRPYTKPRKRGKAKAKQVNKVFATLLKLFSFKGGASW